MTVTTMRILIFPALLLLPLSTFSDERLAKIATYANAVWYAEEYNALCPSHAITVPVSESELRKIMLALDGENTIENLASDPNRPEISFRDAAKELAQDSIARGCNSQLAEVMRTRTEENLVVPDFVREYQNTLDDI